MDNSERPDTTGSASDDFVRTALLSASGNRHRIEMPPITYKNQNDAHFIDPHSPTKLYTGQNVDTTDRTMLHTSESTRFDPVGFRKEKPLLKDIFHTDPYITCSNCNFLNFVDVVTIRRMLSLPEAVSEELKLAPEVLPPCVICGAGDCFIIGSHDFAWEVAERKRIAEEKARIEKWASSIIQKAYRNYLRRMYGSALSDMFLANKYLQHVSALLITSMARGRLGRRIAKTKRALKVIAKAHPLVIRHSLRSTLRGPKVFWYKRKVELDMLFDNYLELVSKLGYQPPRKTVEDNVQEIARRVLVRQNTLIVLVQRRWRGFMAKRVVRYFRTEIARLFQFRVARVMRIQRVYRGHFVRVHLPKMYRDRERVQLMDAYLLHAKDVIANTKRDRAADITHELYRGERATEKTCRFTSRVGAAHHYDMRKMKAFRDSPYADDRLTNSENKLLAIDKSLGSGASDNIARDQARKQFMEDRIAEYGPTGFGYRSVPMVNPPRYYYFDQELSHEDFGLKDVPRGGLNIHDNIFLAMVSGSDNMSRTLSARSKAFSHYFSSELEAISNSLIERIANDHSKKGLAKRFKEFNDKRLAPLRIKDGSTARLSSKNSIKSSRMLRLQRSTAESNSRNSSPEIEDGLSSLMGLDGIEAAAADQTQSQNYGTPPVDGAGGAEGITNYLTEREKIRAKLTGKSLRSAATATATAAVEEEEGKEEEEQGGSNLSRSITRSQHDGNDSSTKLPDVKGVIVTTTAAASDSEKLTTVATLSRKLSASSISQQKDDLTAEERKFKERKHVRGNFRYPEHIYFNAMEWLYQDYDL